MNPGDAFHRFNPVSDNICTAPGCTKDKGTAALYCTTHYMRMHRTGRLDKIPYGKTEGLCDLGRNLHALRLTSGLTTKQFGKFVGLSWPTVYGIMRGSGTNLDTLRSIAAAFNIEVWELLKPDQFPVPFRKGD